MRIYTALIALCLIWPSAYAADEEFHGIEELMTAAELRASGVGELSPAQIAALNAWLASYRTDEIVVVSESVPAIVAPAAVQVETARQAALETVRAQPVDDFRQPRAPEPAISSRIIGDFSGWTGKTQFALENGQVWVQRRGRRWKIRLQNPEVLISKNFMGAYEMEIVSAGRSIGVRRLR